LQSPECRHVEIRGQVQGVGFRPFVFRLAQGLGLRGEVYNQSTGVGITVEGPAATLDRFVHTLRRDAPGAPREFLVASGRPEKHAGFAITPSREAPGVASALLTDQAICAQCRDEFLDPRSRRFAFPFISCTHCGPRYSVCERLPYDRANTSWRFFSPCEACAGEHAQPQDRRFHAVGISCPTCGPQLYTPGGLQSAGALESACAVVTAGGVLAVKGTTGFHLVVDATNADAVARLRERKRRSKPLALLAPDLAWIRQNARVDAVERAALESPAAPIVILRSDSAATALLAPAMGTLGVTLPNSGIQLALLQHLQRPLVLTSANVSGAPLIFANDEACRELSHIADEFLLHDLPLLRGLDDSVVRCMAGRAVTLRLGRGLAPQVHTLPAARSALGCSAHLKASLAVQYGTTLLAGPHLGDLEGAATRLRYREQKRELPAFFQVRVDEEVTDLHPDYASTLDADYRAPTVAHHVAHAMAAWLEEQPQPPFTVLTWDGIGLGPDGTIWGGECLAFGEDFAWRRVGSIRPFLLPPGHAISRFPGRVARVLAGEPPLPGAVPCSSMGRLIEGLAALAGLREENRFEAQVSMEWEALATGAAKAAPMDFALTGDTRADLDWRPMLPVIVDARIDLGERARGLHAALARGALRQARRGGANTVLLAGGVFQNRLLVELLVAEGQTQGLHVIPPGRVPPNDGGIALGQCAARAMGVAQTEGPP
jgi:hydrogenase maturation protein HypF